MNIENIRNSINKIDGKILNILSKRKNLVGEIAAVKKKLRFPVFDEKRENEIMQRLLAKARQAGLSEEFINKLFSIILENSRDEQKIFEKEHQSQNANLKCSVKKVGLIGFGRFGQLIVKHLSKDFKFYVNDKLDKNKKMINENAIPSSLEEACQNELVVLAVPISELENILKKIRNLLKKDCWVMDVCSVKEYPVNLMKSMLPENVRILATHPMFGPDSAADSLTGRKIALCKVRLSDRLYAQAKLFFESKGLIVIETTPEKHDEEIASSLALTHFIGRALMELNASALEIDTEGYKRLMKILDTVKNDTWQLFEDMNNYNRFSKKVREDFINSLLKIDNKLRKL